MSKTTGIEVITRALDFLNNIKESNPTAISSFVALELTGDQAADQLLSGVSLMMLQQLKNDGIINADDLSQTDAKIYGLTEKGIEIRNLFLKLAHS